MLSTYVPILGLFALAAAFALFSVTVAPFVGPRRFNRAKLDAYECGIEPVDQPLNGGRFPVRYYLTAMLFIVFDIEIVFLYPWAVANDALGVFGLVEMVVFIATVFLAYAYVWRRGGLEWGGASHGPGREAAERRPAAHRREAGQLDAQVLAVAGHLRPGLL